MSLTELLARVIGVTGGPGVCTLCTQIDVVDDLRYHVFPSEEHSERTVAVVSH